MNINDLPDLNLCTVFSKLPLRDLLRINLVCSHWKTLQPAVTCNVKKIVILIGEFAIDQLNESRFDINHFEDLDEKPKMCKLSTDSHEVLDFNWLDKCTTSLLISLLPNITDAQVSVRNIQPTTLIGDKSWGFKSSAIEQITDLLTRWVKNLKNLRICLKFMDFYQQDSIAKDMPQLLKCINSMQSLQNLALSLHNYICYKTTNAFSDMSILAKLETFYLSMLDNNELIYDSLLKYALPNPNLREIGIDQIFENDVSHSIFTSGDNLKLHRKMYQLPCLDFTDPNEAMRVFCDRFCNLRQISISIRNFANIYKMISFLLPLKSLLYLHIDISFNREHGIVSDLDANFQMMQFIPVLPSVKILNVFAPVQKHTDLLEVQWHVMFPNVEVLHYHNGWSDCQICRKIIQNINARQIQNIEAANADEEQPLNLAINGPVDVEPNADLDINNQDLLEMDDNENNDIQPENEVNEEEENAEQEIIEEIERNRNLRNLDIFFGNENEASDDDETDVEQEEVVQNRCLRLSIQPWRFCNKLRKVYTGVKVEFKLWELDELFKDK